MASPTTDLGAVYAAVGLLAMVLTPVVTAAATWGVMKFRQVHLEKRMDSKDKVVDDLDKRLDSHDSRITTVEAKTTDMHELRNQIAKMSGDLAFLRGVAEATAKRRASDE